MAEKKETQVLRRERPVGYGQVNRRKDRNTSGQSGG